MGRHNRWRHRLLLTSCGTLWLLFVLGLAKEVFWNSEHDAAQVLSLGTLALVTTLCLAFGPDLLERLKRFGPLELYAIEVVGPLEDFKSFRFEVKKTGLGTSKASGERWIGRKRLEYEKLDRLASAIGKSEYLRIKDEDDRKQFHNVLFYLGTGAVEQGDWPRAEAHFKRLQQLSDGYELETVSFNLGMAYIHWGIQKHQERKPRDPRPRELFELALKHLTTAMKDPRDQHRTLFWLAYALDEVTYYRESIRRNLQALGLQGSLAPAKYNIAVTHVKLGEYCDALQYLGNISDTDTDADYVLDLASHDEDLNDLRRHPLFRMKLEAILAGTEPNLGWSHLGIG